MWMSNCLIMVNRHNDDANNVTDIAAAVAEMGSVVAIDEREHVIEAAVPAQRDPHAAPDPGVSYVRCVFNYFCGNEPRKAA